MVRNQSASCRSGARFPQQTMVLAAIFCVCCIGIPSHVTVDAFLAPTNSMAGPKAHTRNFQLKNTRPFPTQYPVCSGKFAAAASKSDVVPGIGEEGCKLPSPSGVNVMDDASQAAIFVSILVALGVCTFIFNAVLAALTTQFEWFQSFRYSWSLTLGPVFMLAGVTHFTVAEEYRNIYPYQGAWGGLWKLPGSADFHVAWTGVAEFVGGAGLLAGGLIDWLAPVYFSSPNIITSAGLESDCAAALFLLTWAVTPANIFMFTHGAKLPMGVEEPIPVSFHVVRFVMQVVLLGFLYQMGEGTFDALL